MFRFTVLYVGQLPASSLIYVKDSSWGGLVVGVT